MKITDKMRLDWILTYCSTMEVFVTEHSGNTFSGGFRTVKIKDRKGLDDFMFCDAAIRMEKGK